MPNDLRRILLEAVVILALGALIGLSFNVSLVMRVLAGRAEAPAIRQAAEAPAYPAPAMLEEVRELAAKGGAVLVDARIPELFADGHIAGARSLPLAEVEERLPPFRSEVPPDALIVTYCGGYGCPDSFDLAVLLLQEGYRDVRVFEGGFPEWRDAGLPVKEGPR